MKTVGERLPAPGLVKLADVVAIPTSLGFAYARKHGSVALGIFDYAPTKDLRTLNQIKDANAPVAFFVEYCEPIDYPDWVYLGNWKFNSEKESQSPAVYIEDSITPGVFRILEGAQMRAVSKEEVAGLNQHVLLFPQHVREKIEDYFRKKVWERKKA